MSSGRVRFAAFLALVVAFWPLSALAASPHQLGLLSSDQSIPLAPHWRVVSSPNVNDNGDLYGIVARSMHDVWAAGSYYTSVGQRQTLIAHWDGARWKVMPRPDMPGHNNYLTAVTTLSPRAAVAVGYYFTSTGTALPQRPSTLVEAYF
jgi:hypothetical protein